MLSAAVTVSACTHTDCGWQQEDIAHSTMSYTSAILPCSASTNPVSGAESAPVCGCQSRRLPVLTANWALFSEVPEAGSPPRKACVAGSSLSLHLIIQPVWDYTTLPHHVLVINYFPHLPKSVPIACNQLNEHHSTYIITHACGFPSTASRHLHTCGFPSQPVHFLLKHVQLISYSHYKQLHDAYYFCTYHFFHILDSLFRKIPRSEVTEAKVTDIIIALERYCQDAF